MAFNKKANPSIKLKFRTTRKKSCCFNFKKNRLDKIDKSYICSACEEKRKRLEQPKQVYHNFEWDLKGTTFLLNYKDPKSTNNYLLGVSKNNDQLLEKDSNDHSSGLISNDFYLRKQDATYVPLHNNKISLPEYSNNWEMQIKYWSSKRVLKFDIYLMSIFTGNYLRQASVQEKCFILENIKSILKPRTKSVKNQELVKTNDNLAAETLFYATKCYFHFINPFFPLFTQKGFSKYPRSKLLKIIVWRSGLEYIPHSQLKSSLIHLTDKALHHLLRPSLLAPTLDTIQSLLIFNYVVFTPSLIPLKITLFGYISSIFYALGLHDSVSPPVFFNDKPRYLFYERQLAINQLNLMSIMSFFREELPLIKPKRQITFRCIHLAFSKHSSLRHKDIASMQEDVFSDIKLNCEGKKACLQQLKKYEYNNLKNSLNPNKLDIVSSTLDLAILVHELFYHKFAKYIRIARIKKSFVDKKIESGESYIKHLALAEKKLSNLFLAGFSFFNKLKIMRVPSLSEKFDSNQNVSNFIFNSFSESEKITVFETFNCFENINICQMQFLLCIQYHFHRLELMKLDACVDFSTDPPKISKAAFGDKVSLAVSRGIFSAVKLIDLTSMISEHAFLCKRGMWLFSATRFIIQHFRVYSTTIDSTLLSMFGFFNVEIHENIIKSILISALQKARAIIIKISSASITKYNTEAGLELINDLLKKHNIIISHS